MIDLPIHAHCKACFDITPHEIIPSVQRGRLFIACIHCGTVQSAKIMELVE